MKRRYYADTDSLYIELSDKPSVDSREVAPGIVIDFDANKQIVGIDIQKAKKLANLSDRDQVLLSKPEELSEKGIEGLLAGEDEIEKGEWVAWEEVLRKDV
ncbi:MAG: hypothetical protein BZY75_00025 [SAR202 cluster bacterium Io17-Chloro-G7]|nr:MAG: hypothetical protein BZY75_00025 [SAR202 cluster bacterium Io17-Chloro-G7]